MMAFQRLKGMVGIVTGGAGGIGAATARRLCSEGAVIVLADVKIDECASVVSEINQSGGECYSYFVDLADERSIKDLYHYIQSDFGKLNILHNNAADTRYVQMSSDTTVSEVDNEVWDRAFLVNAKGTHLMLKHGIPVMLATNGGSIINTSSTASITGSIFNPAYGASKASINSMTYSVAMQYGRAGIRCNAILPGLIVTKTYENNFTPELTSIIERQIPLPYHGVPEDIAASVAFLSSSDARFITGQLIVIDGGLLSHMPQSQDMLDYFNPQRDF